MVALKPLGTLYTYTHVTLCIFSRLFCNKKKGEKENQPKKRRKTEEKM